MKQRVMLILCILFALMMLNSGLNKLFQYLPMPEMSDELMQVFGAFMTIKWVMPLVATIEIVGGILMAIPKTRALGAIVIFPVMVGIMVHHLVLDIPGIGMGLVLFAINVWVIYENRDKYMPMIEQTPVAV